MSRLCVRAPDDFHVHVRQGERLADLVPLTAACFRRALIMPNIVPPVATARQVQEYRRRVRAAGGEGFGPLMTIKLLETTTPEVVYATRVSEGAVAAKLYPRGVTTNAEDGVTLENFPGCLADTLGAMEQLGMVLSIHGEMPGAFCLDREVQFLSKVEKLRADFPKLKIVLEHITTETAVNFVARLPETVAATITVHHLFLTLDDVVGDTLQPHHFCKPVAKFPRDREALRQAALSGNPKFFLGTDSAPHPVSAKECAAGCAGVFTAPVALPLLAELFDDHGALDRLEPFIAEFGAAFYGLPRNREALELLRCSWTVPERIGDYVPFRAGQPIAWECRQA